jgi:hypothetical protein
MNGGPGARADLSDAQPAAPHEQQHRLIPKPIDESEHADGMPLMRHSRCRWAGTTA